MKRFVLTLVVLGSLFLCGTYLAGDSQAGSRAAGCGGVEAAGCAGSPAVILRRTPVRNVISGVRARVARRASCGGVQIAPVVPTVQRVIVAPRRVLRCVGGNCN